MAETLLSDAERQYITQGIKQGFRSDGRTCFDYRKFEIESNVISNCFGSAHIRLGNNDVMAAVKVDLMKPENHPVTGKPQGQIEFFADLSANASPFFEGRGGEEVANSIVSSFVDSFNNSFDFNSLAILDGSYAWRVNVDILILEVGSFSALFDACSIAVKVALINTKIPEVKIDELGEVQLLEDTSKVSTLDHKQIPLFLTITRIGRSYVVDATQEEEAASLTSVLLAFNFNGELLHSKKVTKGTFHADGMKEIMPKAKELTIKLHQIVEENANEKIVKIEDMET